MSNQNQKIGSKIDNPSNFQASLSSPNSQNIDQKQPNIMHGPQKTQALANPAIYSQKQNQQQIKQKERTKDENEEQGQSRKVESQQAENEENQFFNRQEDDHDGNLPTPHQLRKLRPDKSKTKKRTERQKYKQKEEMSRLKMTNHIRSKSFQQHRKELQKQLEQLIHKKSQIEQLRQNKLKLRLKLQKLQVELKGIKNQGYFGKEKSVSSNININAPATQGKGNQFQKKINSKNVKNLKLRPIILSSKQKQSRARERHRTEFDDNKTQKRYNENDIEEEEVKNYYFEAELNHKCLNCKHYGIKIEDVRIPNQIKKQFDL